MLRRIVLAEADSLSENSSDIPMLWSPLAVCRERGVPRLFVGRARGV